MKKSSYLIDDILELTVTTTKGAARSQHQQEQQWAGERLELASNNHNEVSTSSSRGGRDIKNEFGVAEVVPTRQRAMGTDSDEDMDNDDAIALDDRSSDIIDVEHD